MEPERQVTEATSSFRSYEDFSLGDYIGTGSFCEVSKCLDKVTGKEYAMKQVPKGRPGVNDACAMEANCLRRLDKSRHIVELFWDFDTSYQWVGILEFCEGGELWTKIRHYGCGSQDESAWYASQMIEALVAVHAARIVHRDIKCENFLLTRELEVKLIDFGTARDTAHPELKPMLIGPQYEHHVGTPNFMSPEAVHGKANDRQSDLWSLGCSIYQLIVGAPPFNAATPFLVLQKAQAGQLWCPSNGVSPQERDLISQLVQVDPDHRISARSGKTDKVLSHVLLGARPLRPPAETLLSCSLRHVAEAIAEEGDAAIALDEKVTNEANADEFPPMHILGGGARAADAPKVGEPTSSLLIKLIDNRQAEGVEVEMLKASEALLNLVQAVSDAAKSAAATGSEDASGVVLGAWRQSITSHCEGSEAPLLQSCSSQLQRFVELAEQRRIEASEQPDFGDISDDEDEEEDAEEEDVSEKGQAESATADTAPADTEINTVTPLARVGNAQDEKR